MLVLATAGACVLLPVYASVFLVLFPTIVVTDYLGTLPPLAAIGEAEMRLQDVISLVLLFRAVTTRGSGTRWGGPVAGVTGYLAACAISTAVAVLWLPGEVVRAEGIAFARLLLHVAVFYAVLKTTRSADLEAATRSLDWLGRAILVSVVVNLLLSGWVLGEVQLGEDTSRYFGPVGDQVGFILTLFVFKSVLDRQLFQALLYAFAVAVTGTRGALLVMALGMLIGLVRAGGKTRGRWVVPSMAVTVLAAGVIATDFGGLKARLLGSGLAEGLAQRAATFRVAVRVIGSNPVFGVGFSGFRLVALEYGAWDLINETADFVPNATATAQNQYLQVTTDGGIVCLAAFAAMMWSALRTFRRAAASGLTGRALFDAGAIWLLALLVGNQGAAWLVPGSVIGLLFWVLFGYAAAAAGPASGRRVRVRLAVARGRPAAMRPVSAPGY